MPLFGTKRTRRDPPIAENTDASANAVLAGVDRFLSALVRNDTDGALDAAQGIFLATLIRPVPWVPDSLNDRGPSWPTSRERKEVEEPVSVARIALLCQVWNRMILTQEPRLEMGRLVRAPRGIEQRLYTIGLRAMFRLPADDPLVPGLNGWSVADATEHISTASTSWSPPVSRCRRNCGDLRPVIQCSFHPCADRPNHQAVIPPTTRSKG